MGWNILMERKIDHKLAEWKKSSNRKPLILRGARQVGKTYAVKKFGKRHYEKIAYFDIEQSPEVAKVFERDLNPSRIVKELSAIINVDITSDDTLIVLDEIQANNRALTALKYFNEDAPQYHIIATGSLLGMTLDSETYSFPVGKVETITLYPMDFEEFLWALDRKDLCDMIRNAYIENRELSLHQLAMDHYQKYLFVGGLPVSINEFVINNDVDSSSSVLKILEGAYIADMSKYATPLETTRIIDTWRSIPGQLSKENKKFQYKGIKSGARSKNYEFALHWLDSAGIINRCEKIAEGKIPIKAYVDNEYFKIYMMDTGLLCSKLNITSNMILSSQNEFDGFKGVLAENYIMQALVSNGLEPYYWASNGRAEVDFVIQNKDGLTIPIEGKSSTNVRSKSLKEYVKRYNPEYSMRVSAKNFGFENKIKSIPLYAVFCIDEKI